MIAIEVADLTEWSGQEIFKEHPAKEHHPSVTVQDFPHWVVMVVASYCGKTDIAQIIKQSLKTSKQTTSTSSGVEERIHIIYYPVFS